MPVASPDRLNDVLRACTDVVCLLVPERLWAVGQFYEDFSPIDDEQAVKLLRKTAFAANAAEGLR